MAQYQRIQVVEARQYEGPGRLPVISDALGEQQAMPGDWLLGSERGKITVKNAADFASEGWAPYSATPSDDEIKALSASLDSVQNAKGALEAEKASLTQDNAGLHAQVADLSSKVADGSEKDAQILALTNKNTELTAQLTAAQASLDAANTHLKNIQAAQAVIQAETAPSNS